MRHKIAGENYFRFFYRVTKKMLKFEICALFSAYLEKTYVLK